MKKLLYVCISALAVVLPLTLVGVFVVQCSRPLLDYAITEQKVLIYASSLNDDSARLLIAFTQETISKYLKDETEFRVPVSEISSLSLPPTLPPPVKISGSASRISLLFARQEDSIALINVQKHNEEWVIDGLIGEVIEKPKRLYPKEFKN